MLGEIIQNIASVFVLFLLITVTFTITAESKPVVKYDISEREIFDRDIFVLNFLKTPVDEKTFRDLFIEAYYLKNYNYVKSEAGKFFLKNNDEKCPIAGIIINEMPSGSKTELIFINEPYFKNLVGIKEVSSIVIPLKEPKKYLNIKVNALC